MEAVFSQILNMTLTGSLAIGLVLPVRYILRRQPKVFSYALWTVVLFRLLCPVSLTAPVSVVEVLQPEVETATSAVSRVTYIPASQTITPGDRVGMGDSSDVPGMDKKWDPAALAAWVWAAGVGTMGLYSLISYGILRRRLADATPWQENIFLADHAPAPFVLGVLRPRIYLPSGIPQEERGLILAHERHHIRRGDPVWKLLAFAALCLHWFNPLVWLAFRLAGQDMEMSCDEAVLRQLGSDVRGDYAAALLRLATKKSVIGGTPLAFGEGDTKGRVLNMAKWKKPKLWVSILCGVLCAGVLVACGVNPGGDTDVVSVGDSKALTGAYGLVTPDDCEVVEEQGRTVFYKDGKIVGGLEIYPIPEGVYDPEDKNFFWLEKVGIPDYEDSSLCYTGGITEANNGWDAEFASDVPPGETVTVRRRHSFFAVDGKVYDLWVDCLQVNFQEFFIRFLKKNEETLPTEERAEYDAIDRCRDVMELVEQGSAHVVRQEEESGRTWDFYSSEGDFLTTMAAKDGTMEQGYLYFNDTYFQYGQADNSNNPAQWKAEDGDWEENGSWLGNFLLNRSSVALMGTTQEPTEECVMLRVDKFFDMESENDHYFANFYFDSQGRFEKVKITVNLFQENEFSFMESIVTLDEATVRNAIQAEYEKAVG